jgi:hypothetical protein
MDDDRSVPLRRKDHDHASRRDGHARAPLPGAAPACDASERSAHVGLPSFLIASLCDNADDSLDLAFAADLRQATAAGGEMFSIGMALLVAGLSKSDRTSQNLGRSAV